MSLPSLQHLPAPLQPVVRVLWLLLTRFWFCWVITYLSYRLQENYPFSNNPMYTRWDDETYVLYTTDEKDQMLFFDQQFGQTAIRLKKMVKKHISQMKKKPETKELSEAEMYRRAGQETMRHFHEKRWAKVSPAAQYAQPKS
jgi:hypothetical protein